MIQKHSQAAFVPGRAFTNNIMLGHELVKGYDRYMTKMGTQKAYGSVEQDIR